MWQLDRLQTRRHIVEASYQCTLNNCFGDERELEHFGDIKEAFVSYHIAIYYHLTSGLMHILHFD